MICWALDVMRANQLKREAVEREMREREAMNLDGEI